MGIKRDLYILWCRIWLPLVVVVVYVSMFLPASLHGTADEKTLDEKTLIERAINFLYFVMVTYLTIGYGDMAPSSAQAQLAPMVGKVGKLEDYSVLNIAVCILLGPLLLGAPLKIIKFECRRFLEVRKMNFKIYLHFWQADNPIIQRILLVVCFLGFILLSIMGIVCVENMHVLDAIYLVAESVTTIGYGNVSFTAPTGRFLAIFWLPLALVFYNEVAISVIKYWLPSFSLECGEKFEARSRSSLALPHNLWSYVFNFEHEVPVEISGALFGGQEVGQHLSREEIVDFLSMENVSRTCLLFHMRRLSMLDARGIQYMLVFVRPLSDSLPLNQRKERLVHRLRGAGDQIVLAPYLIGEEWVLLIIHKKGVYFLDPVEGPVDGRRRQIDELKFLVNLALCDAGAIDVDAQEYVAILAQWEFSNSHLAAQFRAEHPLGDVTQNKMPQWYYLKCPWQHGKAGAGYYVMEFMNVLCQCAVDGERLSVPAGEAPPPVPNLTDAAKWFFHRLQNKLGNKRENETTARYTQAIIDDVRSEWADYILEFVNLHR